MNIGVTEEMVNHSKISKDQFNYKVISNLSLKFNFFPIFLYLACVCLGQIVQQEGMISMHQAGVRLTAGPQKILIRLFYADQNMSIF